MKGGYYEQMLARRVFGQPLATPENIQIRIQHDFIITHFFESNLLLRLDLLSYFAVLFAPNRIESKLLRS